MVASFIKFGVDFFKKVSCTCEVFWARGNWSRCICNVSRQSLRHRSEGEIVSFAERDVVTSTCFITFSSTFFNSRILKERSVSINLLETGVWVGLMLGIRPTHVIQKLSCQHAGKSSLGGTNKRMRSWGKQWRYSSRSEKGDLHVCYLSHWCALPEGLSQIEG